MIYSFLDKKTNEELSLVPDVITERNQAGNYFVFEFNDVDKLLRVTEIQNNYDDKDVVNEYHFRMRDGDQVVAMSMTGLTVLKLIQFGIKVSLYDFDYQNDQKISWLVSSQ